MCLFDDVKMLKDSPDSQSRRNIALKITEYYNHNFFDDDEKEIANDILRLLTKDVEVSVREALSKSLKENENIPHDIALTLAKDVSEVSIPILEFSKVLNDEDLAIIIEESKDILKSLAISRRKEISEKISSTLINLEDKSVIENLFKNPKSDISNKSLKSCIDKFPNEESLLKSLIDRGNLNNEIIEKLALTVSSTIRSYLESSQNISKDQIDTILSDAAKNVKPNFNVEPKDNVVNLSDNKSKAKKNGDIKKLCRKNNLSTSHLIKSLCIGKVDFFVNSLSVMANVPVHRIKLTLSENNSSNIKSLFEKTSFPQNSIKAIMLVYRYILNHKDDDKIDGDAKAISLLNFIRKNNYEEKIELMGYICTLIENELKLKNNA